MNDSKFVGKLWFESFGFHFKERKKANHLKDNTEEEYISKIKESLLDYDKVFYINEENGQGKHIDKLYFFKDKWSTIIKFTDYDVKIITSFPLRGYKDCIDYFKRRRILRTVLEVKDGHEYKRIIDGIQARVES